MQHFIGGGVTIESNMNPTSERPGITADSHTGEMSAIAARVPVDAAASPQSDDSKTAQLPIPENKVCPI